MLRRTAAVLFLALFLALPASAQGIPGLSSVGVKGGASFATLRGDVPLENGGEGDLGYDTGLVGGIYGQAEFFPFFTPRLEVLYVQKGAVTEDIQDAGVPEGSEVSYNLDYIEIPVLAKFNLPIIRQILPSLYAGPYISFAVNRSTEVENGNADNIGDAENLFDSTDYGLVLGTDVDFTFAGKALTLSGRYDLGLANVVNDESLGENEDIDLKTGTFMVTLGVGI